MSRKSFLCSSFNPFYPLKCVLGAGENELQAVKCLAFLSMAITEDPQRWSMKLKTNREVRLGCFVRDYSFTSQSFLFLLLSVLLLVFPCLVSAYLCLALLSIFLFTVSLSVPIFPSPFPFSDILPLFSLYLISTLLLQFWYI